MQDGAVDDRDAGEAIFLLPTLGLRRGGVTRAVLARLRLYARAGVKTRLLLTGASSRGLGVETAIRARWDLPDSVEMRYFWREAAPGGGGAPPPPAEAVDSAETTAFTEETSTGQIVRWYSRGLLTRSEHRDQGGAPVRVDHHDRARRVVSREHYDEQARLVHVDECDPESGQPMLRRWFDASGHCWLTNWLNAGGTPTTAVRHRPEPRAYDNYGRCVAEWVDQVIADIETPVLFADLRAHDHVLLAVTHPRVRRVPVLHNCHTSRPHRADDTVSSSYQPLLADPGRMRAVVALTHRQRDDIRARFGASNVTVINHPAAEPPPVQAERQQRLLVTVARLDTQKRLDHAIRAFAKVVREVPDARFDIYGTGRQHDALWALVEELELPGRVRFRGFTDAPVEKFAGAAAAVLSSWHEGMPLVLSEAMAVGTPFISYDMSYGPAEVIRHDVDGMLVPPGDIDALAAAMTRVLSDPDRARCLGKRAREVVQRFSADRWRAEWLDLYDRLVADA